jgi:signal transduction histidine kinase/ABC-type amino acid transport substrate-binding protein/DNA-binding response OmpR family regulator
MNAPSSHLAGVFARYLILLLLSLTFSLPLHAVNHKTNNSKLELSANEKQWLTQHPTVRLGVEPNWPPYSFIEPSGKFTGFSADIIKLVEQRLNININVIAENDWATLLEKTKNHEIDLISNIVFTPERKKYLSFTTPYFKPPSSIFIHSSSPEVNSLKDLFGKTVAVENQYSMHERLTNEFPQIKLLPFKDTTEALKALSRSKVDAYIGNQGSVNWIASQNALTNIKLAQASGSELNGQHHRLAVRKDWPLFASILNKVVANFSPLELSSIRQRWLGVQASANHLFLSNTEIRWLKKHPLIELVADPNGLPYESFDEQGNYIGIVAEYLKLIEKRLGIKVDVVQTDSWSESVNKMALGTVDILSASTKSELPNQLNFTRSFLASPIVIVMNNKEEFVENIEQIKHKNIVVVKSYGQINDIKKKYPRLKLHVVDTIEEALTAVSTSRYDALLANLTQASYHMELLGTNNLRIVGSTQISSTHVFGMRPDYLPLTMLFNKAIASIKKTEQQTILKKWGQNIHNAKVDYAFIAKIAAFFLSIIAAVVYWNLKLSKEIKRRKTAEAQTQEVINAVPLQIIISTPRGEILSANPQTFKDHQAQASDLSKYNMVSFYEHKKDRDAVIVELKSKGKVDQKVVSIKQLNGVLRSMMLSIIPIMYNGKKALLTVSVDVTERVETEAALHKARIIAEENNRFKSQFLANMSHEIRSPLNAIVGLGHLLADTPLNTQQSDYVKKTRRSSKALLNVIDDILDFSKIEAHQLVIEDIEFALDDVLSNISTLVGVGLDGKRINYIFRIDKNIPSLLIGDPHRLTQILSNLISNAIKFTQSGHIILSIKSQKNINPQWLDFTVEDTGIGIAEDKINTLFEPFIQADGSTTRRFGGTGLGLSICRSLCEAMGGSIDVSSTLGTGSKFHFKLPFKSCDKASKIVTIRKLRGLNIMLLNNNSLENDVLTEMLKSLSFDVELFTSSTNALKRIQAEPTAFDLVLLNWRATEHAGVQVAKILRENEQTKHIPIILMTTYAPEAAKESIDQHDLNKVLIKPISPSQLLDDITETMLTTDPIAAAELSQYQSPEYEALQGTVVLVEDNLINQEVGRAFLEQMGLEVRICNNGAEAVEAVLKEKPNIVLMDIQMPKMDGYEATRLIRNHKTFEDLPIVAMTAHAMSGDEERSLKAGMNGHITKPIDPDNLYATVKLWLNKLN